MTSCLMQSLQAMLFTPRCFPTNNNVSCTIEHVVVINIHKNCFVVNMWVPISNIHILKGS